MGFNSFLKGPEVEKKIAELLELLEHKIEEKFKEILSEGDFESKEEFENFKVQFRDFTKNAIIPLTHKKVPPGVSAKPHQFTAEDARNIVQVLDSAKSIAAHDKYADIMNILLELVPDHLKSNRHEDLITCSGAKGRLKTIFGAMSFHSIRVKTESIANWRREKSELDKKIEGLEGLELTEARKKELDDTKAKLSKLDEKLKEAEKTQAQNIGELQKQLVGLQDEKDNLANQLEEIRKHRDELFQALEDREKDIADLTSQIDEHKATISKHEVTIEKQKGTINEQETTIQDLLGKTARIQSLENEKQEILTAMEASNKVLKNKDSELGNLNRLQKLYRGETEAHADTQKNLVNTRGKMRRLLESTGLAKAEKDIANDIRDLVGQEMQANNLLTLILPRIDSKLERAQVRDFFDPGKIREDILELILQDLKVENKITQDTFNSALDKFRSQQPKS